MKLRAILIALLAFGLGSSLGARQQPQAPAQGRGAAPGAAPATQQRGGGAGSAQAGQAIDNAIAGRGGSDAPGMAPLPATDAPPEVQAAPPMHVYIRVGLKSHGVGQHDYPQFIADWSKILTEHGAIVDGSFHFPSLEELSGVNVLVMFKGDQAFMGPEERATVEAFVKRGGGIVTFHDTLCGDDPAYFATLVGGAKTHGEVNFSAGDIKYTIVDQASPIMKGLSDFTIKDEAFFKMTWAKDAQGAPMIHVLATAPMPASGEVVPQIWTYEHTVFGGQPARAFVWMQGHTYTNFTDPRIEPMLLRGIAWAAHWPVDTLLYAPQPRPGGRGGPGGGRGGAPGAGGRGGRAGQGGNAAPAGGAAPARGGN